MKVGVVTFPGSNCDDDCIFALRNSAGFEVETLWHKNSSSLGELDLIVLPGGFSYGDYLRSGAMASVSPIMANIKDYAGNGGLVLGICNGFQILCESGLLPGALVKNQNQGFICRDVELEISHSNPWTSPLPQGASLNLPVAHGEGRYFVDAEKYHQLENNGQIVFRYKEDINGSFHRIAGLTNEKKNVCGMMPHPERASDLRSRDGMKIWNAIHQIIKSKR